MKRILHILDEFYHEMEVWDRWKQDLYTYGHHGWVYTNRIILLPVYHSFIKVNTEHKPAFIYPENIGIPLSEWLFIQRRKEWTPILQKKVYTISIFVLHAVAWIETLKWCHENIDDTTLYIMDAGDASNLIARILVNKHTVKGTCEEAYKTHRPALYHIFEHLKHHIVGVGNMKTQWSQLMNMILHERNFTKIINKLIQIGADDGYEDICAIFRTLGS